MSTKENPAGTNGGASERNHVAELIALEHPSTTAPAQAHAYALYPLADIFPLMDGCDFDELVADIKANGLIEDIVLFDGMILDGRNRYRACIAASIEPTYRPFTGDEPDAFVISVNLRRRHLSTEQKRAVIAKLLAAYPEKSDRQIAETAEASPTTVGTVRSQMESTVQIGQLPKRVGKDGKTRRLSRTERRRVRLDRAMGRHSRLRSEAGAGDHAAVATAVPDSNPLITAWDAATRTQRHDFIMARKVEVLRAQQQIGPAAHEVAVEPTTPMVADGLDDIPPFLDRTAGQR